MASSKGMPFILGAKVVGVSSLVLSLYLLVLGIALAVFYYVLFNQYCTGANLFICQFSQFGAYAGISVGVYGLIFFIVSVMLLVGVNMDRPNLMVPFILWMVLSLLAVLGVSIYMSLNQGVIMMIVLIVTAVVCLVLPVYFLGVVAHHSVQLRKTSPSESKATPVVPFQQQPQIGFVAFTSPHTMMPTPSNHAHQMPVNHGTAPTSPLFSSRSNNSQPAAVSEVD